MYLTTHLICCRSCKIHIQVFQTTVSHFEQQNLFVLYSNTLLQTVFFVHELIYVFQINGTLINAREAVNFKIREINAYATPKKCQEFVENRNKFILILGVVNLRNVNNVRGTFNKRRGTQRGYSSKPLNIELLNIFQYSNGRYRHIFIP